MWWWLYAAPKNDTIDTRFEIQVCNREGEMTDKGKEAIHNVYSCW